VIDKIVNNIRKKSLKERFLLVIGILFFLVYLFMGLAVIFWKDLPFQMKPGMRIAFGGLLIVYSFYRFIRFFNANKD
jgi:hypothetical protein